MREQAAEATRMPVVGEAFVWGLLAATTLTLGALVAVVRPPHERALGLVMAFGSGALLSAVSFELIDEAVSATRGLGATAVGFFAGALAFAVGDLLVSRSGYANRKDIGAGPNEASGLTIVLGALLDGIPESAVLGLTILTTGEVGMAMLVAIAVSNVPEGVAATTSLHASGWTTRRVMRLWTTIAVASGVSAALGYRLLDGAGGDAVAFILAFAGGAILTMLSTSMIPEAHEHAGRAAGLATVAGFAFAFFVNWLEA